MSVGNVAACHICVCILYLPSRDVGRLQSAYVPARSTIYTHIRLAATLPMDIITNF